MLIDMLMGQPIVEDAMGIVAAHLYYFLAVLYPRRGGAAAQQTGAAFSLCLLLREGTSRARRSKRASADGTERRGWATQFAGRTGASTTCRLRSLCGRWWRVRSGGWRGLGGACSRLRRGHSRGGGGGWRIETGYEQEKRCCILFAEGEEARKVAGVAEGQARTGGGPAPAVRCSCVEADNKSS